jgi:hypothetical protein
MLKYYEFKNTLESIKKPEDFMKYFIYNMNSNMKNVFF